MFFKQAGYHALPRQFSRTFGIEQKGIMLLDHTYPSLPLSPEIQRAVRILLKMTLTDKAQAMRDVCL